MTVEAFFDICQYLTGLASYLPPSKSLGLRQRGRNKETFTQVSDPFDKCRRSVADTCQMPKYRQIQRRT